MRKMVAALTALLGLACVAPAHGDLISYTESITTDGSLGGQSFSGRLVTLTFTADTANVAFSSGTGYTEYTNVISSATVNVAGVGSATFDDSIRVAVQAYATFSDFLATDLTHPGDILDTFGTAAAFAGYDLKGPFGPASGGASYPVGTSFATSLGDFVFTNNGGGVSTVLVTVPEPSSLALAGLGLVGIGAAPLRRRLNARRLPVAIEGRI